MAAAPLTIRPFAPPDEAAVVALWQRCGLVRPWNDPHKDIARKLQVQRELFLVGMLDDHVVATAMAGYDGHRGWINYLAVEPTLQRAGLGRQLLAVVEMHLRARGCPKINLQIRSTNQAVIAFYERLGYRLEDVASMGKRLIEDAPFAATVVAHSTQSDATYHLRYFFDAGSGVCLWSANDAARTRWGYPVACDRLSLTTNTRHWAAYVLAWYDTSFDWNDPGGPSPWTLDEAARFDAAAQRLLGLLRAELGPDVTISDESGAAS
jgi:ribosomal protein S18 acetylase RimI-like enzyme